MFSRRNVLGSFTASSSVWQLGYCYHNTHSKVLVPVRAVCKTLPATSEAIESKHLRNKSKRTHWWYHQTMKECKAHFEYLRSHKSAVIGCRSACAWIRTNKQNGCLQVQICRRSLKHLALAAFGHAAWWMSTGLPLASTTCAHRSLLQLTQIICAKQIATWLASWPKSGQATGGLQ